MSDGVYDHFIKVPCKQTSLELGARLSKLCTICLWRGKKTQQQQLVQEAARCLSWKWQDGKWQETAFHSSNCRRSVQPVFQCLKTPDAALLSHFHIFVQTTSESLPFFFQALSFFGGTSKSYQTQASPPPFPYRQCGMNFKCHHGRKKCTNSFMGATVKLFPVVFFKKNLPCTLFSVIW